MADIRRLSSVECNRSELSVLVWPSTNKLRVTANIMINDHLTSPRQYQGVMISSTFTDLEEHRRALIRAIKGQGLTDVAMENDSAKADLDVIDSSLQMVRDSSAYI